MCRYPHYVYQMDLACQVLLSVIFAIFAFFMIKWEKLVKEKQWIIYSISLACIIIIEVNSIKLYLHRYSKTYFFFQIADLLIVYFATFTEQAPK